MQETQVWSLGQEDPMEKEMATHSSILAGEPHGQWSLGYSPPGGRVRHEWAAKQQQKASQWRQTVNWDLSPPCSDPGSTFPKEVLQEKL